MLSQRGRMTLPIVLSAFYLLTAQLHQLTWRHHLAATAGAPATVAVTDGSATVAIAADLAIAMTMSANNLWRNVALFTFKWLMRFDVTRCGFQLHIMLFLHFLHTLLSLTKSGFSLQVTVSISLKNSTITLGYESSSMLLKFNKEYLRYWRQSN